MNMFKGNEAKTPQEYIAGLDEPRKSDIMRLDRLIRGVTPGWKPYMLSGMLAYGTYHHRYASGREGDWSVISLSSRKNYISLYVSYVLPEGVYLAETYKDRLPKADIGKSCIRFKKVEDINLAVVKEILTKAVDLQI